MASLRFAKPAGLRMRLGISTWAYAKYPIEEALLMLASRGFHVLELWADQSQLDPRFFPKGHLNRVRELSGSLGLIFHTFHAPFTGLDVASPYEREKEESIRWVLKALEYASKLECRFAVLHPGSSESMAVKGDASEARDRLLDGLRRLGEGAKSYGVKVLLENMIQREERRYGSRIEDLVETIEALGEENFGLCLDPGHTLLSGLDVYEELRESNGLLSIHANDNDGIKDLHLVPLKAETSVDWVRFLRILKSIGYGGPFMLEVHGGEDPDRVVEDARALCERLPGLQL